MCTWLYQYSLLSMLVVGFLVMVRRQPRSTHTVPHFPYSTLFRSSRSRTGLIPTNRSHSRPASLTLGVTIRPRELGSPANSELKREGRARGSEPALCFLGSKPEPHPRIIRAGLCGMSAFLGSGLIAA